MACERGRPVVVSPRHGVVRPERGIIDEQVAYGWGRLLWHVWRMSGQPV